MLPIFLATLHGGITAVRAIPVRDGFFGGEPLWLSAEARQVLEFLDLMIVVAGVIFGAVWAIRVWRFLVIKRLRWMTAQEVADFEKRNPDF